MNSPDKALEPVLKQRRLYEYFPERSTTLDVLNVDTAEEVLEHLPPEDRLTVKDVLQSPCNLTNIDKAKSSYNPWPMERHFELAEYMVKEQRTASYCFKLARFKADIKKEYLALKAKFVLQGCDEPLLSNRIKEEFLDRPKKGRCPLIGTDMQKKLVNLITAMEKASTIITPLIVASTAKKLMISSGYGNLLKCNGGSIEFTPCWAYSFLKNHMQWSNRKPTTARKLTPVEAKHAAVEMSAIMDAAEDYHPRLVLMMDETMVPWIPVKGKTYAPKGQKKSLFKD
ncbi:hypothetical protein P9112_003977 [Eukaryota sp. TZLM1-RC]